MGDQRQSVALIIPTHNEPDLLARCIDSIGSPATCKVIPLVVNAGQPLPADLAARVCEIPAPDDHFWTMCIDLGMRAAKETGHDWIMFTNADTELMPGSVDALMEVARANPNTCVCSPGYVREEDGPPTLLYSHDVSVPFLLHNYLMREWRLYEEAWDEPYEVSMVGGQGVVFPARMMDEVWVDPKRFPHNRGDMDLWLQMRERGYRLLMAPKAGVINNRPLSTSGWSGWQQLRRLPWLFGSPLAKDSWRVIWNMRVKHLPWPLSWASFIIYTPLIWVWRLIRMTFRPA